MATLKVPTPLRPYANGLAEVSVQGTTAAEALHDLITQHPALQQHLYNNQGSLRPYVNLFIGSENIKDLDGLETPLPEDAQLRIIPSIAGGALTADESSQNGRRASA
jgi:molybdopterin converting factor small subunit